MPKRAFITGVTGQDGSYLADLLIAKGYDVYGLVRQSTQFTPDRWGHLRPAMLTGKLNVVHGDLADAAGIRNIIEAIKPDEVYNLAAQSHVGLSFEQPLNTVGITGLGPLNVLEALRRSCPAARYYQASSSEMFGKVLETPQSENTRFYPRSPYGCAKVMAHYLTQNYREAYNMFACSGILFNHESERRGESFVTRKITRAVGRIHVGTQKTLELGPIYVKRDWGYAPDYVEAMWMMLQHDVPKDYVIGTGEQHSVREFVELAFSHVGLDYRDYVVSNDTLYRPSEVDTLCADNTLAGYELGWRPKTNFTDLVKKMVDHDVVLAASELHAK